VLHRVGRGRVFKLNDSIYWHDGEGLYVNLFFRRNWTGPRRASNCGRTRSIPRRRTRRLRSRRRGRFLAHTPCEFRGGLQSAPTVKLNGKALDASAAPGSYLALNRTWKAGDKIEMELPCTCARKACPTIPTCRHSFTGRWCWPAIWAAKA